MSLLIKNGRIITADADYNADIFIEGEVIQTIGKNISLKADVEIDAAGKLIRRTSQPGGGPVFYTLSGENAVARGIYMLDALVDGKHYTARILKQ